jgi:hypothetical protein
MASASSPPEPRPSVSNRRCGRATSSLVALLLATACVPTAAAQERPAPDPQELWRQFPLDDARTQQVPTNDAPRPRQRPTPVSSTEAGESTGDDLHVLGLAAITLATVVVITLATGALAALRGPVWHGRGRSSYAPASRPTDPAGSAASVPRTRLGREVDELETLKVKREADRRAAKTSAPSIDDIEALKAKLSVPATRKKESRTNDDLEILKSKREAVASAAKPDGKRSDGVNALKSKLDRVNVAKRERTQRQAIDPLRAKLRERPESREVALPMSDAKKPRAKLDLVPGGPAPALRARPTPAKPQNSVAQGGTNRSGRNPRGAAAPALVSARLAQPAESRPRVRCRVTLWRGYVKSQFYAIEQSSTRGRRVIAQSSLFRMRGGSPLPQQGAPAGAHATLIENLEQDGWCVVARGPRWFDVELERAEGPPLRGLPER